MPGSGHSGLAAIRVSHGPGEADPAAKKYPMVLSWLPANLASKLESGAGLPASAFDEFLHNAIVVQSSDTVETAVHLPAPARSGTYVPIAIRSDAGNFWACLAGSGGEVQTGVGKPDTSGYSIELPPHRSRATVPDSLWRRIGVSTQSRGRSTRITVWTPPGYDSASEKRYPAVYFLPGLGSDDQSRFRDRDFTDELEAFAIAGNPFVAVGIDSSSTHGSHYLSPNSARDGWLDLIGVEIPTAVDAQFRTAPTREKRILAGVSTGAFNAISFAIQNSKSFGSVVVAAPDALDLGEWLCRPGGRRIRDRWLTWMRIEEALGRVGQMSSYAASFASPGAEFCWPADLVTGKVIPELMSHWLSASPSRLKADGRERLKSLNGRLIIGASADDEFDLTIPTKQFSAKLKRLGIAHRLALDSDGHFASAGRLLNLLRDVLVPLDHEPS